jgi:hypothetical protein
MDANEFKSRMGELAAMVCRGQSLADVAGSMCWK